MGNGSRDSVGSLRGALINFVLLAASVALCVAALEIYVRLAVPAWYPGYAFTADPATGYVNTPNKTFTWKGPEYEFESRTNAFGFRDDPWENDGRRVIFALGDSFAWGFGVPYEKNHLTLLEKKLGYRVVKTGVCGYGTLQAERMFAKNGAAFRPEIVLLDFFIGNDFYENTGVRNLTVVDGRFREIPPESSSATHKLITWLRGRLRIVELVIAKIKESPRLFELVRKLGLTGGELIGEMDLYRTAESPRVRRAYEATEKILERLKKKADTIHARLVVVIIPTRSQVDPVAFGAELARMNLNPDDYDLEKPNRWLREALDAMRVQVIDLTPGFRSQRGADKNSRLYFEIDRHWTEQGHALAARLIAASLFPRNN